MATNHVNAPSGRRMIFWLLASGFYLLAAAPSAAQLPVIEPRPGLLVTESVRIKPGTYRLPAAGEQPLITVRGSGITLDFQGSVLEGSDPESDPDGYAGTAVLVDGGSDVTITNAVIRGYKIAVMARGSANLHLTRNDFSHNWKERLWSGIEHESLLDWMSYHSNEQDEWLRFGGAIYLDRCDNAELDHNIVRQGQNALMVSRSSGLFIWNNDFSFNSSLGIGLYRVSNSRILHNRVDFNVRGYSHGYYNRGQDSAGLLMYEQSSNNIVAYNSITHGGDGLFLWAGQSTMDTGEGGANDNLFYRNDFSHAPTNGIEATFSRNYFIENRIEECWHGVWGGYSWNSIFDGNRFANNDEAIAIEHGQDNRIRNNHFEGDRKAIRLWANASQDPNWGYPKNRDTRSRNYDISYNRFNGHDLALEIDDTTEIALRGNTFDDVATRMTVTGTTDRLALSIPGVTVLRDPTPLLQMPALLDEGIDAFAGPGLCTACPRAPRGREHIIVDQWGPYDYRSPKLWPEAPSAVPVTSRAQSANMGQGSSVTGGGQSANMGQGSSTPVPISGISWISEQRRFPFGGLGAYRSADRGPFTLNVLGPAGAWKSVRVVGGTLSAETGAVPGSVTFTPDAEAAEMRVDLEYVGTEIVTPRGRRVPAGEPFVFSYVKLDPKIDWSARWFALPEGDDAAVAGSFADAVRGEPVLAERVAHLDFISGGALRPGLPADRVALVAEGRVVLPPGPEGTYRLQTISDDGVRVWVDGRLVIDNWDVHESEVETVAIGGGAHTLKVEYFEASGWAELRLDFVRLVGAGDQ